MEDLKQISYETYYKWLSDKRRRNEEKYNPGIALAVLMEFINNKKYDEKQVRILIIYIWFGAQL